jgi:dUTP pyrophosphatase
MTIIIFLCLCTILVIYIIESAPTLPNLEVKIKRMHPEAIIPKYAKQGDAGMDLTATEVKVHKELGFVTYNTGIAIEIPEGYVGLIYPRSSIYKTGLQLSNCVGVIDSGYRGEIQFKFYLANTKQLYLKGDRIGQIIITPHPYVSFKEVKELSKSDRGTGGYGSTGR